MHSSSPYRVVVFELLITRFQYPSPCTDTTPNGVRLSVSDNTSLAYYAPLANTNWPELNATDISFTTTAGKIPVWSPRPNQLTSVTACMNTTDRESLELVWSQDNFTDNSDYWYLHIQNVSLGNTSISNISVQGNNR